MLFPPESRMVSIFQSNIAQNPPEEKRLWKISHAGAGFFAESPFRTGENPTIFPFLEVSA